MYRRRRREAFVEGVTFEDLLKADEAALVRLAAYLGVASSPRAHGERFALARAIVRAIKRGAKAGPHRGLS